MKKVAVFFTISVALLVIITTVFIYIAPRVGFSVDSITSGSMEPFIPKGAMIMTKPADPEDIEVGDVILFHPVFWADNMLAHRVVEIDTSSSISFVTQGDANLALDPGKVTAENLLGKVCITLPGLGGLIEFVKTTKGFISLVAVPSAVVLAAVMYGLWIAIKENQN